VTIAIQSQAKIHHNANQKQKWLLCFSMIIFPSPDNATCSSKHWNYDIAPSS